MSLSDECAGQVHGPEERTNRPLGIAPSLPLVAVLMRGASDSVEVPWSVFLDPTLRSHQGDSGRNGKETVVSRSDRFPVKTRIRNFP
jgi:hypothetical protein